MSGARPPIPGLVVGLALGLGACDPPECIDGPSNLTPEATAACAAPPEDSAPEDEIVSAGAELRDDGTLVLTISSLGLACGTEAGEVPLPDECSIDGWVFTIEIPPELAVAGVLTMSDHPEIRGTATILAGFDGGQRGTIGAEPFFVGELELSEVNDDCITGVLRGFGTGDPDPTLGGPELDGSFVAPRC